MEKRSEASLKRENERKSPKTLEFKNKINEFLTGVDPKISYSIKRDLSVMTNMPFYKDRPEVIKVSILVQEMIIKYAELFVTCEDQEFIVKLIKSLKKLESNNKKSCSKNRSKK